MKVFIHTNNTNVEQDMCDYIGNIMSHCNSNRRFQETFGSHTGKTSPIFTWNVVHNTKSSSVLKLEAERWGSPLVPEKYM